MPSKLNLKGKIFGDIEVLEETSKRHHGFVVWIVRCNKCNKIYKSTISSLRHSKSCFSCSMKKHGHGYDTPTYKSYWCMRSKCYNKNNDGYHIYGGRGITICDRWLDKENGFINFLEDMGERPSKEYVLSRSDKDKNYNIENCKWLSKDDHKKNRKILKGKEIYNFNGYTSKNIPLFDTYILKLFYAEDVRRNPEDENILQVKCTYCGKWYTPTLTNVKSRINSLTGKASGENRFYCSDECKKECSIYNQNKYPKGFKINTSREVQPQLRQMVFEIDNWKCQRCGSIKSLHCHHLTGIEINPIESADVDNCITFCKKCHGWLHKQPGHRYIDMRRKKCKKKK